MQEVKFRFAELEIILWSFALQNSKRKKKNLKEVLFLPRVPSSIG